MINAETEGLTANSCAVQGRNCQPAQQQLVLALKQVLAHEAHLWQSMSLRMSPRLMSLLV
jgi:hypothetical protein